MPTIDLLDAVTLNEIERQLEWAERLLRDGEYVLSFHLPVNVMRQLVEQAKEWQSGAIEELEAELWAEQQASQYVNAETNKLREEVSLLTEELAKAKQNGKGV